MITPPSISAIATWHAALAAGDPDGIAAVTHPNVELVGPRGSGFGVSLVQEWALRSGIRLEPLRWFAHPDRVVVEQRARWLDPETGTLGDPVLLATAFAFTDGLIGRIARYPDLPTALAASNLSLVDEHSVERSWVLS